MKLNGSSRVYAGGCVIGMLFVAGSCCSIYGHWPTSTACIWYAVYGMWYAVYGMTDLGMRYAVCSMTDLGMRYEV